MADTLNISLKKTLYASSTTSPYDKALAGYRIERFMLDKATSIATTITLRPKYNVDAETLELAAIERMRAILLAFDNTFEKPTAGL
jgi:hypothetical protein